MLLGVLILLSLLFGIGFVSFVVILRTVLMISIAFFRLLDYASAGAPGHGPIHLLVQAADDLGFFWDSDQAGWIRPGLPPLRYAVWAHSAFSGCYLAGLANIRLLLIFASVKGFGVVLGLIFMDLTNYLSLPILGNETKCCFEPSSSGGVWNGFLLSKVKKEDGSF